MIGRIGELVSDPLCVVVCKSFLLFVWDSVVCCCVCFVLLLVLCVFYNIGRGHGLLNFECSLFFIIIFTLNIYNNGKRINLRYYILYHNINNLIRFVQRCD